MDRPELTDFETSADGFAIEPSLRDWGDDWVHELIEMTRPGIEINLSRRGLGDRVLPFQFDDFR